MVKSLVKIQDSYVNTYHPDFMGGANSITNVFDPATYQKANLTQANLPKDDGFEVMSGDNDKAPRMS